MIKVCCGARDLGDTGRRGTQPALRSNGPRVQPHVHQRPSRVQGHVGLLLLRGVGLGSTYTATGERAKSSALAVCSIALGVGTFESVAIMTVGAMYGNEGATSLLVFGPRSQGTHAC